MMIRLSILFALLLTLTMGVQAQAPMTNKDVISMNVAKVSKSLIEAKIQSSPTKFDLTTDGLIELETAGCEAIECCSFNMDNAQHTGTDSLRPIGVWLSESASRLTAR